LLIPSLTTPRNHIDVYLEPLVNELIQLWEVGVEIYDVLNDESFILKGVLVSTITNFLGYGNLSCWKTKGKFACTYFDDHL